MRNGEFAVSFDMPLESAGHGDAAGGSCRHRLFCGVQYWTPSEVAAAAMVVAADIAAEVTVQLVPAGAEVHWWFLQSDQSM